jgi:xanthine dehydrogenase accessory factor
VPEDVYREIVRVRECGVPAALATIVAARGSTPGKESMKMLVRADGGFVGTVGGGCLEADVYEAALEVMRTETPRRLVFRLNERDYPDSGLYCGGTVEVYLEPLTDPTLTLFGAGHVSKAIAAVAREAGFRVVVADDRETFASRARFPEAAEVVVAPWAELASRLGTAEFAYVVVVTRGHHDDAAVLEALWRGGARPRYLGMIGSRAKWAILSRKLRAAGVPDEWLARVRTPMGLRIGARTHGEIAVSVAAELVLLRRTGTLSPALLPPSGPEGAEESVDAPGPSGAPGASEPPAAPTHSPTPRVRPSRSE